jgi:hypothetical protein
MPSTFVERSRPYTSPATNAYRHVDGCGVILSANSSERSRLKSAERTADKTCHAGFRTLGCLSSARPCPGRRKNDARDYV